MKYTIKQLSQVIYSFGYSLILIAFLLQISNIPNIFTELYDVMRILRIGGYGCCFIKLLSTVKWKKASIAQIAISILCIAVAAFVTDSQIILTDVLLIIGSKDVDIKNIMRKDLVIRAVFAIVTISLCVSGVVPDIVDYRNGILSRHSLGFAHPNRLALHIFMICLYLFYLNYSKIRVKHILIIATLGVFALLSSDGRTSCLGIAIILILSLIKLRNRNTQTIIEQKTHFYSFFVYITCILFSLISPILYLTGSLHVSPDSTFGSRIVMAARGLSTYGLTVFGQKIEVITSIVARLTGQQANGIDNLYVYLIVNFGVFVFVIFLYMIWQAVSYAEKHGDKIGVICCLLIIIMGVIENQFMYIESNLFLIYVGQYWLASSNTKISRKMIGDNYEYSKN